ncbi:threonine synthase [Sediminicurvatus halobius]|uniref:Threonine synthase n=1 Tax=Sediminicurvatus halobius TaxID=2182432 RepID=A0A2U2N424_9GAMM|nr:threonine synthase [Spiribacter halobius]PWG63936.1 threonine synthase [Spiribacter halobius]UEX76350.1 threonine synthase [Spiribacter halobius]
MPFRARYTGLINKYHDRLPLADDARVISLGEGNTPLIRLNNIPRDLGRDVDLYVKFEGLNPTGSFKDRGMTVAVTQAVSAGSRAIICASTGNTSASAAAYAARAGIRAFVLIPDGKIAMGKLAQAIMHGAEVLQIRGNFDAGMRIVKAMAEQAPVTIVNSVNPYRLQGQKTAAFEIVEELERVPDYHCLPVGNAGNITAHWIGYSELALSHGDAATAACSFCSGRCRYNCGIVRERPVMVGYQASGAAPFLRNAMVDDPETVATAIRIGHPQSWDYAWAASRESGGWFDEFPDEAILEAQYQLAAREGVFCEPASAASVAGAMRDIRSGRIPEGSTVVCTLTGHGLKDPDVAQRHAEAAVTTVDATSEAVRDAILGKLD